MKLLTPSSARFGGCHAKKQLSDARQQVTKGGAVHDCLAAEAENKDGHNMLIYSEVEHYFSATSGNRPYPA